MSRRAAAVSVLLLLAAWPGACGGPLDRYHDTREDWTRETEVYEHFESRVFVKATLKTEPFVARYVEAYAEIFDMTPEQRETLRAAERADVEDAWVFVVALFTNDIDWDDLAPGDDIWSVHLENRRGQRLPLGEVRELDTDNPTWGKLFPYVGYHDSLYELRFDEPEGGGFAGPEERIHLVIAGAPAHIRLTWTLPGAP
ncbi:MAG: hypothetical protein ACQEXJ_11705 [Myxococcota bacterium]